MISDDMMSVLEFLTHLFFTFTLGWYLITNLQWYNYKLERVVLKHHKVWWHIIYFIIPYFAYQLTDDFFSIFFYFAYLPAIILWQRRLDKPLVLTWRVRRYFFLLVTLTLFQDFLCYQSNSCVGYGVFLPLALTIFGSFIIEKYLYLIYKKQATTKLNKMVDNGMKIVAVTGSFGKTSTKNFIAQILSKKYIVHATPRSVNTEGGIMKDINEELQENTQIYIVEAGARERGDIYNIAQLIHPHYAVVGVVGQAHIEYFKTLENIVRTKLELMQSNRLVKAFIHKSVTNEPHEKVIFFGDEILNIEANLDGIKFNLNIDNQNIEFKSNILGDFQATNILAAILVAKEFGLSFEQIQDSVAHLNPIPHRLERINAGGKIILDDGFNGNLDGMLQAISLVKLHKGRKIIVTPGLVESSADLNLKLINAIDNNFDLAIITGNLNANMFEKHLKKPKVIILPNKKELENILSEYTKFGDIILFANDAPNFI